MKPVRTLVVMASESRLRLAENAGVGKGVTELSARDAEEMGFHPNRYADTPGRSQAAPGMASHGLDRHMTDREQAREGFAGAVIDAALGEWRKGGYDRLVLAAPPKMLGALRPKLPAELVAHLALDLDKDLTKLPAAELAEHLDRHLAV